MTEARFQFGKNWARFLSVLNDERIAEAEKSLLEKLKLRDLRDLRFLDVGCGSGLFSLAARRLGARVHSFDYDPESVACALELRSRYFPGDPCWQVEQGSVLDLDYLRSLGEFDIVYSWGVLHHTGQMWQALGNVQKLIRPEGTLFISIYNDQGRASERWRTVKARYNRSSAVTRGAILSAAFLHIWGGPFAKDLARLRPLRTIHYWRHYGRTRGMSAWHDLVDWVGGYPFEVATPEAIFDFFHARGLMLESLKTCGGGRGCNEFVFRYGENRLGNHSFAESSMVDMPLPTAIL